MYANPALILSRFLILLTGATAFGQGHMTFILLKKCFSAVLSIKVRQYLLKINM